ncbi:B3/4 domain-containing protein [Desulforamulus aeronauticus]|uniref:B3/B4 domain-containing protein (DNA/RNA-binding domain of Phe-tRNA-synthetase) n=1 Tax=Desulforamulus aeronauticus DSM 10349 TaxID=1121421 RepID=A0A1M6PJ41_9FIRM|nr:phenylalanine--tRNA ligase beta subunit-related protein [Desulforamulus aeronauticus]SHK07943.1 B3/B4 domain-containing protein (DNA/RNA-binding domain of Phe-tRNA-synthetase) [Desulforamulus aeronauticus DSM 10349]
MKISISDEVSGICPKTALGVLSYKATVVPSTQELIALFEDVVATLFQEYSIEKIAQNPHITATRQAYKALGKSPHEYRNAAEAMLRRIVQGKGLYQINNIVEVNNLISITSGYSIGSYDANQLKGNIELQRAASGSHYDGIGKASINIEYLPTLYDELGAFGNPSSDSRRAMIQLGDHEIVTIFYSFDGAEKLDNWMERFSLYLKNYCGVMRIEKWVV